MRSLHIAFAAAAVVALGISSAFAADTDTATAPAQQAAPATQTPAAATPDAQTVAAKDPKAIVCKRMAPETGTRLGSRMQCLSNAQWDEITRQSQDAIREKQRSGATTPDSPG